MKRLIVSLTLIFTLTYAASIEFPICTSTGDQLYPDVCWDGEAFWVVWQDEELGTIRGVRVSENGELLTDEVELLEKGPALGPVHIPSIAAGLGRLAVEARVMVGYNEFFPELELWGVIHREFAVDGEPLTSGSVWIPGSTDLAQELELGVGASAPQVLFGRNHFFSLYKASYFNGTDGHAWSWFVGFDDYGMTLQDVWSSGGSFEFQPSIGCWDGERFVVLFWGKNQLNGAFVSDSIYYKEIGEDFSLGFMVMNYQPNDLQGTIKYQAFAAGGTGYFIISERGGWHRELRHQMVFHILDSTVMPVDSGRTVGFFPYITCSYPDAVFVGENFVCVWENRYLNNNTTHLYAIEVDTSGEILKSGYVVQKSPIDQHPAIAFGEEKYFLVWCDNHEGEFNIYGMLFDTLEVKESIQEHNPLPVISSPIIAKPNIFSATTTLYLSASNMDKDVVLKVYDNTGSLVRRLVLPKGERSVVWDGKDEKGKAMHSGVYFVRGIRDGMIRTTKAVIVR